MAQYGRVTVGRLVSWMLSRDKRKDLEGFYHKGLVNV